MSALNLNLLSACQDKEYFEYPFADPCNHLYPCLDVSGDESPLRAKINKIPEIK